MVARRWIAMLDILGFSKLTESTPIETLALLMEGLIARAQPRSARRYRRASQVDLTLGSLHFSDTIMLWTRPVSGDDDADLHAFFHFCKSVASLIGNAIINDVPLRGGIAIGECYISPKNGIAIGRPIIDAYRIEQAQEWIGAAVRRKDVELLAASDVLEEWAWLVQHQVPVKRGPFEEGAFLALDWTQEARLPREVTEKLWKLDFAKATDEALARGQQKAIDERSKEKWRRTAEFLKARRHLAPIRFVEGPPEVWVRALEELQRGPKSVKRPKN